MAAGESDGEEEGDFVTFGTPLEPLEEGERIKKPVPLQEQTVRDEKGRYKRFHGAFSGGFSAGYFNTVGSKEGWAPSTFVSSRQKRAEKTVLGPEDFMDEEDLSEHGIAPKEIAVTDEYASKSKDRIKEKARQIAGVVGPIPGAAVLDEFIAPPKITVGVDLLRKMGWKEGQGVGPRVKRKPYKQNPVAESDVKIYGCALPPGSEETEEEEDEYQPENVTFAPKDIMPVDLTPKENVHGLGYKGLDPTKALFGVSEEHLHLFSPSSENSTLLGDLRQSKGRKLGILGQAFGVGALEEEDDDIYATESLCKYDTVLKDEEPGDELCGWTAPKQHKSKQEIERELKYIGKILEGFSVASKSIASPKIYPPPDLPRDYRPVHYFRPVIKASSENSHLVQALAESTGKLECDTALQGRHQRTASQRRELLGETSLKGPTTSVLEYLSDKDKERIQEVKQASEHQMKTPAVPPKFLHNRPQASALHDTPPKWQLVLGTQLPSTGSNDFRPFAKDPEKQKRYENYTTNLKHGTKVEVLESCLDPNMTEWERRREQEEFARAAMLYKPSSSVLSSRFTSAKHEDDTDKVEVPRDQETDVDDKKAAANMKMFGKLTRETFEWHPDKLLCKRFNVPDPYSESCIVGLPKVKRDKYSVFNFLTVSESTSVTLNQPTAKGVQQNSIQNKPKKPSRWDVSDKEKKKKDAISEFINLAQSKVNIQEHPATPTELKDKKKTDEHFANKTVNDGTSQNEEVAEEESRPSMDLFKAIFASSSDEQSSSSEEESDGEEQTATVTEPVSENTKYHSPLPFSQESKAVTPESSVTVTPPSMKVVDQGEEFGPKLPPVVPSDIPLKHEQIQLASSPEATKKPKKSKEKHKTKREHKHKKEKKKKHKKSKHKSKHKNKKSKQNSGSDTADSSDSNCEEETADIPPQEFLKRLKSLPFVKR
ncbi:G patch domain-containing protein 1 [Sceloporus undulatus]|uniref:G patch domain-containing protein 1 n=1 Tax=Sceloporus undulatus TaxID=8520 RepID=UPI001C4D8899|nr:G patch domain-containing protein 1 [Sceloporus undulatus]